MSVSETHNLANLRMTREQSFAELGDVIALAKEAKVPVNVSLSCSFGCPMEGDVPASRFDMSLGGIGGCPYAPGASGNVATENVGHMLECMGYDTGLDLDGLIEASAQLETLVEHPLPAQVSRAGPRLKHHEPPAGFAEIAARAHARRENAVEQPLR